MDGTRIDCGRKITGSLIDQNATILNYEHNPTSKATNNSNEVKQQKPSHTTH